MGVKLRCVLCGHEWEEEKELDKHKCPKCDCSVVSVKAEIQLRERDDKFRIDVKKIKSLDDVILILEGMGLVVNGVEEASKISHLILDEDLKRLKDIQNEG